MTEQTMHIESPRILWVAAFTVAVSIAAVLSVREIALHWLQPSPTFLPLTSSAPPIIDTFVCTVVAILVFARIAFYKNPVRIWRRVATVVVILSFVPDVLLARSHRMGGGWPEASALMAMHVVVYAICITVLPALAFTRRAPENRTPERRLSIR